MTTPNTETTVVTRTDLDDAWRMSVIAATRYEDHPTPQNIKAMIDWGEKAQRLQALYDEQYEQWVTS